MLPVPRRQKLIKLLEFEGFLPVTKIQSSLGISLATVYRDLKELENEGLVERINGGARLITPSSFKSQFNLRVKQNQELKRKITAEAAKYVNDGDSLFLAASSTAYLLSKELVRKNRMGLVVITNSPSIVLNLMDAGSIHVTCTAGDMLTGTSILVGPHTNKFINEIEISKAFISCTSLSLEKGICYNYSMVAEVIKSIIKASKEVNLLVDSTKFHETGIASVGPVTQVKRVFVDSGLEPELAAGFRSKGVELVICD